MNWYKIITAVRGNIPRFEDPIDPYAKRKPGDGNGPKMTTPWGIDDMSENAGFGRNDRDDRQKVERSDSDLPIGNDIPSSTYMFEPTKDDVNDFGGHGYGEGPNNDLAFTNQGDAFHENALNPMPEAIGPNNMQKYKVFLKLKKNMKGI